MKIKPETRSLFNLKRVIYDQKWLKEALDFPVYYIYRGIKKRSKLRYDITVILPRMLGKEFPKTKGHEHSQSFKELYKVLEGRAIFLLQKYKNKNIEDVYAVKAESGDVVIVPAGYGHITVNPSKKKLKIGNWISKECKNSYTLFEKKQGACYYYTKTGWIKNRNYKRLPKIRFKKPLKKMPKSLDFLKGK